MSRKGSRQSLLELEQMDEELEAFPIGLGCALDFFREKEQIIDIINSLPEIHGDPLKYDAPLQTYTNTLDHYQEQPHLLDPHLEHLITLLLSHFRTATTTATPTLKHLTLKLLRHLFKTRGPKEVVKRMPHEISDLDPVLTYLEEENLDDPRNWESAYVLVMWLGILVINPFELGLLDGDLRDRLTVKERLLNVCKKCVVLNSSVGGAGGFLVARVLTRPDCGGELGGFLRWACERLGEGHSFATRLGAFTSLSSIFKQAKREEIVEYGEYVLEAVLRSKFEKCDTLLRKFGIKLIQRIGMMFMRTKTAPWRYTRGSRSLLTNLKGTATTTPTTQLIRNEEDYTELRTYSSQIEQVLDQLLTSLKDKDTIVRWSAAKGIGRVTNRLPEDYADEVVEGILANFSPREGNFAWHGGCLALAELARRGLLLPKRLGGVVGVVKRALVYDEIKGNFSVGSSVRDAGCYVLWAFARAFDPQVLEPYVQDIATSLIITMVFDREVNCRRAASAAFQENVGRQGNFPHGIDIVTVADYFAVGVRKGAFTHISLQIAAHPPYTRPMILHLLDLKLNHFDHSIRELTAEALGSLTKLDTEYFQTQVIPRLIPLTRHSDPFTSHGALLSLGAILKGLKSIGKLELDQNVLEDVRGVLFAWGKESGGGRRGFRGSEMGKQGVNVFLGGVSRAGMPYQNDTEFLSLAHSILEDHITCIDLTTRSTACDAMASFLLQYYHGHKVREGEIPGVLAAFSENLASPVMSTRQGYASLLGKLPYEILEKSFPLVINSLIKCSEVTRETAVWAESRRDAINAIGAIFARFSIVKGDDEEKGIPITSLDITKIYDSFFTGINDYTADKRGDIGSWVREAAISSLKVLTVRLHEGENLRDSIPQSTLSKMTSLIAKQCVEKIDNVRVHSAKVFASLLLNKKIPLPQKATITKTFTEEFLKTANWRSTCVTFGKFVELLSIEEYTYNLLEGLVISGGSLSDSVMKDANGAVSNYLVAAGALGEGEVRRIGGVLLTIFENNEKNERLTLPLMKFTSQLLESGTLTPLLIPPGDEFGLRLIELTKKEIYKSSRVEKILAGVNLFCEMLQGGEAVVKSTLSKLMIYLCHGYPRVRLYAAQKMYESLMTYEVTGGEEVMTLLSDTEWDGEVVTLRLVRNRICEVLGVAKPVVQAVN